MARPGPYLTENPFWGLSSPKEVKDGVVIIKPPPSSDDRPDITILTMFTSREEIFPIWMKNFLNLNVKGFKIHVLWLLFPKKDRFVKTIKSAFSKLSGFHSKTLIINTEHTVAIPGDEKGGNWTNRNQAITDGYNFSRVYIDNPEFVLLYEDDVLIPRDALHRLLPYMDNTRIGVVIGRVPYRPDGRHRGKALAWDMQSKHIISNGDVHTFYEAYYIDKQHSGVEEIGSGTFGCTLIRGILYERVEMLNQYAGIMGPDVTYGLLVKKLGYKSLIDWSVHCKQLHETKKGVEVYA